MGGIGFNLTLTCKTGLELTTYSPTFFKWAIPSLFFIYFQSFSNKHYNFTNHYNLTIVLPVSSAGILTYDLMNMSLLS